MTVIAGMIHDDVVWMAADTASVDGTGIYRMSRKLDRIYFGEGDSLIIGTCGAAGFAQAVRHGLVVHASPNPEDDKDCDKWAFAIAEAITELGLEHGWKDPEGNLGGGGLLAWQNRLWHISHNGAMPVPEFTAIGAGQEVALGALEVGVVGVRSRVEEAVIAACRHTDSCREPVDILCTNEDLK